MRSQGQGKELSKPDKPDSEARPRRWPKGWRRTAGPKLARIYRLATFREGTALVSEIGAALESAKPPVIKIDGCKVAVWVVGDGEIGAVETGCAATIEKVYLRRRRGEAEILSGTVARRVWTGERRELVEVELRRCREHLRTAVRRQGRTQREVQERLGWGATFISDMVTGQKRLDHGHLLELLEAIDLHPAEFFAELYGFDVRPPAEEPTP